MRIVRKNGWDWGENTKKRLEWHTPPDVDAVVRVAETKVVDGLIVFQGVRNGRGSFPADARG